MRKLKERFQDPFFRTTWNIVNVQTVFTLLLVLVFVASMLFLQRNEQTIIAQRFPPQILDLALWQLRERVIYVTLAVLSLLGIVFGTLSALYALRPARSSLQFQKRFIGDLAHELRTPLSIIRTNTEVALMDQALEGYARSTLQTTIEELDRISGIINNLLSFETLIRPGNIHFEPLLLRDIAGAVVQRHIEMAKGYGINIGIDTAIEPTYVMGNKVALEQALTNLVKNALNYTPQHKDKNVVVRIDDKGDEVALSVIDTGIGISRNDLIHIFQPFYRGDTSRERGIGSGTSGLGLAIVNDIMRAHNGHITIRSALNRGTTIELSFPKAEPPDSVKSLDVDPLDSEYEEKVA